MERILQTIPHVFEMVSNDLDDQSLCSLKATSKTIYNAIERERLFWIRVVERYGANFVLFENSWNEVITKTPVEIIRKLAKTVQEFFVSFNFYYVSERQLGPLHVASVQGDLPLCQHIIEKTSVKNPAGEFCIGTNSTREYVVGSKGIIFKITNVSGFYNENVNTRTTPLHIASVSGKLGLCKMILTSVIEKNPYNSDGWTPLHMAAANGHYEIVKAIIELVLDKNPKARGPSQKTPYHLAAWNGHIDICRLFINTLGDKNPGDAAGNTPLHFAVRGGHVWVCRLIFNNIANKNPLNHSGATPQDLADMQRNHTISRIWS